MGAAVHLTSRVDALRDAVAALADPDRAVAQRRYMKSAMPYRGVAMGDVKQIADRHVRDVPCASQRQMLELALSLWDGAGFREERYLALAVCRHRRHLAFQNRGCMDTYRHFIVGGAWWDLVDETSRLVGEVLDRDADAVTAQIRAWATDSDMWLRRTAIICQRHRGGATDRDLLVETITPNLGDPEFFIRKAIGWALRQYARTDARWVQRFVAIHEMSALSRREALKHVGAGPGVAN